MFTAAKKLWKDRVTTIFVGQGRHAHDPKNVNLYPDPDLLVERIGDLVNADYRHLFDRFVERTPARSERSLPDSTTVRALRHLRRFLTQARKGRTTSMRSLPLIMLMAMGFLGCNGSDGSSTARVPKADRTEAAVDRDNTAVNKRDREVTAKTPMDQKENKKTSTFRPTSPSEWSTRRCR